MDKYNFFNKIKKWLIFLLICTIIIGMYAILVNPILVNTIRFEATRLTSSAVNNAINKAISENVIYNDIINVTYSNNGKINLIQAKTLEINRISNIIALTTESNIVKYGNDGVLVPLGSFLGISVLSGMGPKINVKAIPIGNVICSFTSKFESAGINQTLHKIYVTVDATVGFVIPFYNNLFSTKQQVLICENIFIGEVPEVYFSSNHLQSLLNFVPN